MSTSNTARERSWWRPALVGSGILLAIGGSMHPSAPDDLGMRDELAVMMSDDAWVPGHALIVLSTILLAIGLYEVRRRRAWPRSTDQATQVAWVAVSLYAVETIFHLVSSVDADALRDNEFAPVAYAHLGLAAILYPASGIALVFLAWRLWASWPVPARVFAAAGMVGGVLHAVSVPLTLSQVGFDTSPIFAFAGVLLSVFTIALGVVGIRQIAPIATGTQDLDRANAVATTH